MDLYSVLKPQLLPVRAARAVLLPADRDESFLQLQQVPCVVGVHDAIVHAHLHQHLRGRA